METRVACFIGWSNTGKTGFVEACAADLSARGIAVGAIKCVHHGSSFNLPGKDSSRFFEAGAAAAVVSDDQTVRVTPTPRSWDRPFAEALFPGAAVVLIEGRIVAGAIRVAVGGVATEEADLKKPFSDFDVVITEHKALAESAIAAGLTVFAPEESGAFIDRCVLGGSMEERHVTVTTGGIEVPLNPFVKETIENVVLGLLKPLKKTDIDGEIVITLGAVKK